MFERGRRGVAVAAMLLGVAAGSARAAVEGGSECAPYVTTRIDAEPLTGELLGSETVTQTFTVLPGGVGGSTSTTFNVGWYNMSDGGLLRLDCRNYRIFW